jgi:hypothetical protein
MVTYEHRFKMCQIAFENTTTASCSGFIGHDSAVGTHVELVDSPRHQKSTTKVIVSDIEKTAWLAKQYQ